MPDPVLITPDRVAFANGTSILLFEGKGNAAADDQLFMFKSAEYLDSYQTIRAALQASGGHAKILEVGVFRGGGTAFLNEYFAPQRLVGVDLHDNRNPAYLDYERRHASVVTTRMQVDQSDKAALQKIVRADFGGELDLVIDDASHTYEGSKATFEATFPYLRPGGIYVLEDWAWTFAPDAQQPDHWGYPYNALVNLVFEFVLGMVGRDPDGDFFIVDMRFGNGLIWLVKGRGVFADKTAFRLDDYRPLRGRPLPLV